MSILFALLFNFCTLSQTVQTPNFRVEGPSTPHFLARLEGVYQRLVKLMKPYGSIPIHRIHVKLGGEHVGTYPYPFYDQSTRRIHLFKSPRYQIEDFSVGLQHELVHAIEHLQNYPRQETPAGIFVKEGFAQYFAYKADPEMLSYPLWNNDKHAFSARLKRENRLIPLRTIIENWSQLFASCSLQIYAQVTSVFFFISETWGEELVVRLNRQRELDVEKIESLLGTSIEVLDNDWRVRIERVQESDVEQVRLKKVKEDHICDESFLSENLGLNVKMNLINQ